MEEEKEQSNNALEVGEKYLSISLLGQIKLACFPNKNKAKPSDPDYTGNGIAVWINEKGSKAPKQA